MTNEWMKQYPSSIVCRNVRGDREYAKKFRGEADLLLYQLKNAIRFNNLGTLSMKRIFTDGTVITAMSVHGRDHVLIDVSRSVGVTEKITQTCTITFVSIPDAIQPMRYPGEIHEGEIENVDYIKTYYTIDIKNCVNCESDVEWTLTATAIKSVDDLSWGEVIEQGEDEGGKYIIWKAYTEESEFSRSGLATLNIDGIIKNHKGEEVCTISGEVSVDCCEKDSADRTVSILASQTDMLDWEQTCEADWCEAPVELPIDALQTATTFKARTDSEEIPGYGSCVDYTWELSGVGIVAPIGTLADEAVYSPPDTGNCDSEITITLRDRCNSSYVVHRDTCCGSAGPLSIEYTSLGMECLEQQTLTASGGCPPYTWEVTSGSGSIAQATINTAIYTAPDTNANCSGNPTITLSDCCGNTAQLELAINCAPALPAGYRTAWVLESTCTCNGNTVYHWTVDMIQIDCDGTEREIVNDYSWWTLTSTPPENGGSFCVGFGASGTICGSCTMAEGCEIYPGQFVYFHEGTCSGTGCDTGGANIDTRSEYLKSLGCCPPQFA